VPQHQWICKLFGFDFAMEYRLGRLNSATDALSHRDAATAAESADAAASVVALQALMGPSFRILDDIRAATATDLEAGHIQQQLLDASIGAPWSAHDSFLLHGKQIFVPALHDLRHEVIALAHSAGHEVPSARGLLHPR
jgi:hypothetical protein